MELWSGPLQPFSRGSPWQKITELLACNLSFSNNNLSIVHTLGNILIITGCLGRPNASFRKKKCLGGKHIKAVDSAVLTAVKKCCYPGNALSWKGTAAEHNSSPGEINTACLE